MWIKKVDFTAKTAPAQFAQSLSDTGFAVITNPPIDYAEVKAAFVEWADFFASAEKHHYLFTPETQAGFFPITQSELAKGYHVRDIKEFFQYYPWGVYPQHMSDRTQQLYQQLSAMGSLLLSWLQEHTPDSILKQLSMPLPEMVKDSPITMLRILHYPPLTGSEEHDALRAAPHEDINAITLLPASSEPGLQALDKQGRWHDVGSEEGDIIVNAGDMLQLATQGYYLATKHRVYNPQNTRNISRFSMPLFLHPRNEVQLTPTMSAKEFLHQRRIENKVI
ncbi:MAG: isopenicillin N synthase family oxygenase [Legionellales bacterium]|nr:isopenicillin N synthase family oxygenase [Legionellales bacterium]